MKISLFHRVAWCFASLLLPLGISLPIPAETPHPVQWTLTASARDGIPLRKGEAVVAHVHALIQRGWHLYAPGQELGGLTGVRISLPGRQPFAMRGEIGAPTPRTAIDPNLNLETRFYEDSVTFTIPLKVTNRAANEIRKVSVDVLYQVCNPVMCLEPAVSHLTSPLER